MPTVSISNLSLTSGSGGPIRGTIGGQTPPPPADAASSASPASSTPPPPDTSASSTPPPDDASASPSPDAPVSGLRLTFRDEFAGTALSRDQGAFAWSDAAHGDVWTRTGEAGTWKTVLDWGNRSLGRNGEQEFYSDPSVGTDPFSVHDGVLTITAAPSADPSEAGGQPYTSGAITTEGNFEQRYGYFEMRAELPAGQGLWPAFWLLPADHSWPPELDVAEAVSGKPTVYSTVHSGAGGAPAEAGHAADAPGLYSGFHTFGASWRPDEVAFYLDGRGTFSTPTPADMHSPMYLLANLAVGGAWPGAPDAGTHFPAQMTIDYVRAWQYDGLG